MIHIKYFRDEKQKFQQRYLSASSKNTQSIQYYYLRALGPEQTRVVPRVTNQNLNVKLEDNCKNVRSYLQKGPRSLQSQKFEWIKANLQFKEQY